MFPSPPPLPPYSLGPRLHLLKYLSISFLVWCYCPWYWFLKICIQIVHCWSTEIQCASVRYSYPVTLLSSGIGYPRFVLVKLLECAAASHEHGVCSFLSQLHDISSCHLLVLTRAQVRGLMAVGQRVAWPCCSSGAGLGRHPLWGAALAAGFFVDALLRVNCVNDLFLV